MNIKIRQLSTNRLFFGLLLVLGCSAFVISLQPAPVSAQSDICANKIEEGKCVKEISDKCSNKVGSADVNKCYNDVKKRYDNVIKECENKRSPSGCDKKVKEKCKDKKGKDLDKCQEKEAANFSPPLSLGGSEGTHQCGKGPDAVKTRFDFGCVGNASQKPIGPIEDLVYALVRFLSYGVGLAIVGSIIVAGIQYSTSEGNPEATQASKNRIQSAVVGLVIYIFAFSLLQYLVPGGIFSS